MEKLCDFLCNLSHFDLHLPDENFHLIFWSNWCILPNNTELTDRETSFNVFFFAKECN